MEARDPRPRDIKVDLDAADRRTRGATLVMVQAGVDELDGEGITWAEFAEPDGSRVRMFSDGSSVRGWAPQK